MGKFTHICHLGNYKNLAINIGSFLLQIILIFQVMSPPGKIEILSSCDNSIIFKIITQGNDIISGLFSHLGGFLQHIW